jgi:septal ring factor EnvC (AmiA/AmiB activator)
MFATGGISKSTGLWTLTVILIALALSGWGAVVYQAKSMARAQDELRERLAEVTSSRNAMMAERGQTQARLNLAYEELRAARGTLAQVTADRDEVKAQLAATRKEVAGRGAEAQPVKETASVGPPPKPATTPTGKPKR